MELNKFKVGDKVMINNGNRKGEIATITETVDSCSYKIDLDKGQYLWSNDMFDSIEATRNTERERQDKMWNELSPESKEYIISVNKELDDKYDRFKKGHEDSFANNTLQQSIMLEDLFGEHNLYPKPKSYEEVAKRLFDGKEAYIVLREHISKQHITHSYPFATNCITQEQANKLLSINKLMNFAAYLKCKGAINIAITDNFKREVIETLGEDVLKSALGDY